MLTQRLKFFFASSESLQRFDITSHPLTLALMVCPPVCPNFISLLEDERILGKGENQRTDDNKLEPRTCCIVFKLLHEPRPDNFLGCPRPSPHDPSGVPRRRQ